MPETKIGVTPVGDAWAVQYHAGMTSKEAAAFKRGWNAAIKFAVEHSGDGTLGHGVLHADHGGRWTPCGIDCADDSLGPVYSVADDSKVTCSECLESEDGQGIHHG